MEREKKFASLTFAYVTESAMRLDFLVLCPLGCDGPTLPHPRLEDEPNPILHAAQSSKRAPIWPFCIEGQF